MGLFDKKYCDICGQKIGFFGNRKLENGTLCKDCAKKLSPFFSDRRNSTVEEIKQQLAYREENERRLADFHPDVTFGRLRKVYLDRAGKKFIVTTAVNWMDENPDLISFSQVTGSIPILLKTTTVIHSQFITKLMATKYLNQFMVQSQSLRKAITLKVVPLLPLVQSLLKNSFNSVMKPQLRTTC